MAMVVFDSNAQGSPHTADADFADRLTHVVETGQDQRQQVLAKHMRCARSKGRSSRQKAQATRA